MAILNTDIVFDQGSDYTRTITCYNDDDTTIDLTGWTIIGMLKKTYCQSNADLSFVITILNQTTNRGEFTYTIPGATSMLLPCDHTAFKYDIKATTASSVPIRLVEGSAKMRLQVSK